MKKVFRTLALAAVVMSLAVACNGNAEEAPVDTTAQDTIVEDTLVEDTLVEEVAEEPVVEDNKTAAKPAAKKQETKLVDKVEVKGDGLTIKGKNGAELNLKSNGETTVKTKNDTKVELNLAKPAPTKK